MIVLRTIIYSSAILFAYSFLSIIMLMVSHEKTPFLMDSMFNQFTIQRDLQLICLKFHNSANLKEFIPEDVRQSLLERCHLTEIKLANVTRDDEANNSNENLEKIVTALVEFQMILRFLLLHDPQDLIPPEILSEIRVIDKGLKGVTGKVENMALKSYQKHKWSTTSWSLKLQSDLDQLQHPKDCQNNSAGLISCHLGSLEQPISMVWGLNHLIGCLAFGLQTGQRVIIPNLESLYLNDLIVPKGLASCPSDLDQDGNANVNMSKLDPDGFEKIQRPLEWYTGAIMGYILQKLESNVQDKLKSKMSNVGLDMTTNRAMTETKENIVVGVYLISSTNNVSLLHICLQMAENYFQRQEMKFQKHLERRIFIFPLIYEHQELVNELFPHYHIINSDDKSENLPLCNESKGDSSGQCNQVIIFNLMALAHTDLYVGSLSDEFGRLVYQLRAALHPNFRITSLNYDPGSWYLHGIGGPHHLVVTGNYSTRVWEMETRLGEIIEPTRGEDVPEFDGQGFRKWGPGVAHGTNLATNQQGYFSTFKTDLAP